MPLWKKRVDVHGWFEMQKNQRSASRQLDARLRQQQAEDEAVPVRQGVGAIPGREIAQGFALRLFPVRAFLQECGDSEERIEPAARLIDGLRNEIGGKRLHKLLLRPGLVRIAPLRELHRAAVVPAVDDLRHAAHFAAALVAAEKRPVDPGLVQLEIVRQFGAVRRAGEQFLLAADGCGMPAAAAPDRQRRPPVAFAGERPVHVRLKEIAETPVADMLREPLDRPVVLQHLLFDRRRPDVPCGTRVIEQRAGAAPAVGIVVGVGLGLHEQLPRLQFLDDEGVGVLDEHPGPGRHALVERAVRPHGIDEGQIVFHADVVVVLAEGGRDVDDAAARVQPDEVAGDDAR